MRKKTQKDNQDLLNLNSPFILTLQIQQFDKKPTISSFRNSLKTKRNTDLRKTKKQSSTESIVCPSPQTSKLHTQNLSMGSIGIQTKEQLLRKQLCHHLFKTRQESQTKSKSLIICRSYIPKLKCKTSRRRYTQYMEPVTINEQQIVKKDNTNKKLSVILMGAPKCIQNEAESVAKSGQVIMRTSQGKRKKIDSFMYFRKIKGKYNDQPPIVNQIKGQSLFNQTNIPEKRSLFLKKDIIQYKTKYNQTACIYQMKRRSKTSIMIAAPGHPFGVKFVYDYTIVVFFFKINRFLSRYERYTNIQQLRFINISLQILWFKFYQYSSNQQYSLRNNNEVKIFICTFRYSIILQQQQSRGWEKNLAKQIALIIIFVNKPIQINKIILAAIRSIINRSSSPVQTAQPYPRQQSLIFPTKPQIFFKILLNFQINFISIIPNNRYPLFSIIYFQLMNDKPFSPSTGQPYIAQNFYMQLNLTKLNRKKPIARTDTKFNFAIFKADQQFSASAQSTIPRNSNEANLQKITLNFVAISYNPTSPNVFALRLIEVINEQHSKEIGQYILEVNQYIDQSLVSENGAFILTADLNDQFSVDMEFYISNSKYGLQRLIRDVKNPKPKKQNEVENPQIAHQRIAQLRRKMDQDAKADDHAHHQQKFKRFQPKRQKSEDKRKSEYLENKRKEEERKARQIQQERIKQEERRQRESNKSKQPIKKKKQWLIPQAEQLIAQEKARAQQTKKQPKATDKKESELTKADQKTNKASRQKIQPVQQSAFLEKVSAINPKILIVIVALLIASGSYLLLFKGKGAPQNTVPNFPKAEKAGKAKNTKGKK